MLNMFLESHRIMTSSNIANVTQSIVRRPAFIDALQPPSAVVIAGAKMISDLEKSIVIPCQIGDVTARFKAEEPSFAENSLTFGSFTILAERILATFSYTMVSLMQSALCNPYLTGAKTWSGVGR